MEPGTRRPLTAALVAAVSFGPVGRGSDADSTPEPDDDQLTASTTPATSAPATQRIQVIEVEITPTRSIPKAGG